MKYIANIITFSRVLFSFIMICVEPLSVFFWIMYLCAGASDILDGYAARKLNQQSESGARLDSIADVIFVVSIFIAIIRKISFPLYFYYMVVLILIMRVTSYIIGYVKYHDFFSIHTYMNKLTGFLIFSFPVIFVFIGSVKALVIIGIIAFLSSLEEILILIREKNIRRDIKSIFCK